MFFSNFKETADKLPDELRLKFYDAITNYVFNGTESDDPVINALITAIKPSLDKTDERGGVREGAGRKSKEIKNNQNKSNEIKSNQNNQSFQETETETETRNRNMEKEMDKEKVAKAPIRFQKPTVEEIKAYAEQQRYVLDAQAFWDFYESKGWKVGNSPMKNWPAAVRNWVRKDRNTPIAKQDDEDSNLSREERFQLFLKRCGVEQERSVA